MQPSSHLPAPPYARVLVPPVRRSPDFELGSFKPLRGREAEPRDPRLGGRAIDARCPARGNHCADVCDPESAVRFVNDSGDDITSSVIDSFANGTVVQPMPRSSVPDPGTWALFGTGLTAIGAAVLRRGS
jgi:hypothetical protein